MPCSTHSPTQVCVECSSRPSRSSWAAHPHLPCLTGAAPEARPRGGLPAAAPGARHRAGAPARVGDRRQQACPHTALEPAHRGPAAFRGCCRSPAGVHPVRPCDSGAGTHPWVIVALPPGTCGILFRGWMFDGVASLRLPASSLLSKHTHTSMHHACMHALSLPLPLSLSLSLRIQNFHAHCQPKQAH